MRETTPQSPHKLRHNQTLLVVETERYRSSSRNHLFFKLFQFSLLVVALVLLFRRSLGPIPTEDLAYVFQGSRWDGDAHSLPHYKTQYKKCPSIVATVTRQFEYNISTDGSAPAHWRLNDISKFESHQTLRGEVSINRGDLFQKSDIEARVVIQSNDEEDIKNIYFDPTDSSLGINYVPSDKRSICMDIQVLVFLRPWPRRLLDVLEVRSEILDIWFKPKLNWEINNLFTHTSHGESTFEGHGWEDSIVVHNISASSVTGEIFGWYVATGNLTFKSENGFVGFFLLPNYGGPFNPESLLVETRSGDIHVEASFVYWTAYPLTHRTDIHTVSGDLWAYIPHGTYTNLWSHSGNISTYIQPFGLPSPESRSEIYTKSDSGSVRLWLEDAGRESLEGNYDPLLDTTSKHRVGEGRLELRYPYSWYGSMEGRIQSGALTFDSSTLEDFQKGEGYVKARRGRRGDSYMEAWVGTGELDIRLGL